jgi:hypothetical protein
MPPGLTYWVFWLTYYRNEINSSLYKRIKIARQFGKHINSYEGADFEVVLSTVSAIQIHIWNWLV